MKKEKLGFDKTGAIIAAGDTVEVGDPKEGDIHQHSFQGTVHEIDNDKQTAVIVDMDGEYFEVDWDNVEIVGED